MLLLDRLERPVDCCHSLLRVGMAIGDAQSRAWSWLGLAICWPCTMVVDGNGAPGLAG